MPLNDTTRTYPRKRDRFPLEAELIGALLDGESLEQGEPA